MTLDDALDIYNVESTIDVQHPYNHLYELGYPFMVTDSEQVIALFHNEKDACHFRLSKVNQLLNG